MRVAAPFVHPTVQVASPRLSSSVRASLDGTSCDCALQDAERGGEVGPLLTALLTAQTAQVWRALGLKMLSTLKLGRSSPAWSVALSCLRPVV